MHIHCRWGHSHTLQRVGTYTSLHGGAFTYIAEGVVMHIHCRGRGNSQGVAIDISGWGHRV